MWSLLLVFVVSFFVALQEMNVACDVRGGCKEYLMRYKPQSWREPSLFFRFIKRMTDVIVSVLVCVTILPLLYVVLGIIIKFTSEGPIIFKQKRIGLLGDEFICYKFRSMYLNSDNITITRNDKHVTPIGRFMRKIHLDEFPQFVNVLKGDMSLVGPRPLAQYVLKEFEHVPEYYWRLLSRPGITGIAQVNSGRTLSAEEVIRFDMQYLSAPSYWFDWYIIGRTLCFADDSF